jgi:hypothetical protein
MKGKRVCVRSILCVQEQTTLTKKAFAGASILGFRHIVTSRIFVTSQIYLVFKKHCIEESNCLTPRDFTFSVCLPLTFDLFVCFVL